MVVAHGARRREEGATTAEYVAVVTIVAALIAALWAVPVVETVGDWARYAVCRLFAGDGTDCERPDDALGAPGTQDEPISITCVNRSESERLGGSLTLFSGKLSGELGATIDSRSDGTYEVSLDIEGGLAAELVAGGKVQLGEGGVREGRSGQLELGADGSITPVYTFTDEQEARDFVAEARELVTGPSEDLFSWRTLLPGGALRVPFNQARRIADFDPPAASRLRVEGGVSLNAGGDLYGRGAGGSGEIAGGQSLGADIDLDAGQITYYVALDSSVAAELGLGTGAVPVGARGGVAGELEGEVTVGITVDTATHRPVRLDLGATVTGSGGGEVSIDGLMFADGPYDVVGRDVSDAIGQLGLEQRSDRAFGVSATGSLDLTDPRAGRIGADVIDAITSADGAALRAAGGALRDHLRDESDLEVPLHTREHQTFNPEAAGGKGLAFGFGVDHEERTMELARAWARPGGRDFGRATCE